MSVFSRRFRHAWSPHAFLLLTLLLSTASICFCTSSKHSEQYGNVSFLPGGGVALNPAGDPDGLGDAQINIPIAYTPHRGYQGVGLYIGKHNLGDNETSNGSAFLALGFSEHLPIYVSILDTSRHLTESKSYSIQAGVFKERAYFPALAVGVQDLTDKEHESTGRSLYLTTTKSVHLLNHPVYLTLGYGSGRFLDKLFYGVSVPIGSYLNAMYEWDGFQQNYGLIVRPEGRYGNISLLLGYNGKIANGRPGFLTGLNGNIHIHW